MYRKIFYKIHLLLGLLAGAVLLIIAFTGTILAFEKQILEYINKDIYFVSSKNMTKFKVKEILENFQEKKSKVNIISIKFSNISGNTYSIKGLEKSKKVKYFINPYNLEILPKEKGKHFFKTVQKLHKKLLLGGFGKQVVGISVICLSLLILTGIYLYSPRIRKKIFKLRLKSKSIHSFFGFWFMPIYLVCVITGLSLTYDWYHSFLNKISGVQEIHKISKKHINSEKYSFEKIQEAIDLFDSFVKYPYQYSLLELSKNKGVYTFVYLDEKSVHKREKNILSLDINSKQLLFDKRYEDKQLNEKVMSSLETIHTGEYFGIYGQFLFFISVLFLPIIILTGFIMFIKKL